MKNLILSILVQILIHSFGYAVDAVDFDPFLLQPQKGTWEERADDHKGEKYTNFYYGDEVVFRILERFEPSICALIAQAKEANGKLRLKDPCTIFFNSKKSIEANFSVVPVIDDGQIIIAPEGLELTEITSCCGKSKFYVTIPPQLKPIKITKKVYDTLFGAHTQALISKKSLSINLRKIIHGQDQNCVKVIANRNDESKICNICMEREKNIFFEPCGHICACEACSDRIQAQEDKRCPSCRAPITSRKRVFW